MATKKGLSLSVGWFLAVRDIKRSNPWTTGLIIFVMSLTFFNMLLLGGILIGVVNGLFSSFRTYYSSDVILTPSPKKTYIDQTVTIVEKVKSLPGIDGMTIRYTTQGLLEYGYQTKVRTSDNSENASGTLTGIDPKAEDRVSDMSKKIVAGAYLNPEDYDTILVGSALTQKYATGGPGATLSDNILKTADVGSRVRLTVNGVSKTVLIKGIVSTGNSLMDGRIYMTDAEVRNLIGRSSLNANEIAIKLKPNVSPDSAKQYILKSINNDPDVSVKTYSEAIPSGSSQITTTFNLLNDIVGLIALIVGAITIFIVIYVNAITRRKYIGILKGIGISATAIEASYVFQAMFYALAGIFITSFILLGYVVPYFAIYPFELPLGKASLAISFSDILTKGTILAVTSFVSGYIPAWIVVKQNTLDAILGR